MENTNQPKVCILLLNWNNWEDTKECLESLKNITYSNFSIVLMDNGSQDDSLKRMREFKSQIPQLEIVILENGKNLGFGGGNNVGINYALKNKFGYILLLNNDTIVSRDFLDKLVEVAQAHPVVGLAVPNIFFHDEPEFFWFCWPI